MPNYNYLYFIVMFLVFIFVVAAVILLIMRYVLRAKGFEIKKSDYDVRLPDVGEIIPIAGISAGQISDWGRDMLQPELLYGHSRGAESVVFVLDTAGVFDHSDLVDSCLPEYNRDFTDSIDNIDRQGHGTHCAGIIAATDNDHGVIGIAPAAKLVAVKVLNDEGLGRYSWIVKALRYVADLNVGSKRKIITMSLGGTHNDPALEAAVNYAAQKGCFLFAAGGNSGYKPGKNSLGYPARYANVISVSATDDKGVSVFSSGGAELDLAAPGSNIFSTYLNGGYVHLSGSSMAAPAAAAMGALILGAYPEIKTQKELQAFMVLHATDWYRKGFDERTGHGIPVADKLVPPGPTEEEDPDCPIVTAADIFRKTFEPKDIERMRERTMLIIGKQIDAPVRGRLRKAQNAAIIIEKLKL